jgi:hypothetical protein
MSIPPTAFRAGRRGFLLLEAAIGAVMVAMAMVLVLQVLGWLGSARRAAERRERAAREVANAMERLTARPWDDLSAAGLRDVALSDQAKQALPGAELRAVVMDEGGGLKRITITLRWRGRSGLFEAPVRLTAWVARPGRVSR